MQVCTSLQTDNHASTPPLSFVHAGCPSCGSTKSVKALKAFTLSHPTLAHISSHSRTNRCTQNVRFIGCIYIAPTPSHDMAIRERRDNGRGRTERTAWKRRPATIAATMLRLLLLLRTAHLHTCTTYCSSSTQLIAASTLRQRHYSSTSRTTTSYIRSRRAKLHQLLIVSRHR